LKSLESVRNILVHRSHKKHRIVYQKSNEFFSLKSLESVRDIFWHTEVTENTELFIKNLMSFFCEILGICEKYFGAQKSQN